MKNNIKVCAVIVTYNRKSYLFKLLDSLVKQTQKLSKILIFDNFSSDGTPEMLMESGLINSAEIGKCNYGTASDIVLLYYRNKVNSGGSGGFHKAMKMAAQMDVEYLWIMDDDVLPEADCLEQLLKYANDEARICVPNRTDANYCDGVVTDLNMTNPVLYAPHLMKKRYPASVVNGAFVEVCDMPFEGPLIAVSVVKEIGLPKEDLFIFFDDTDFAHRACSVTQIRFIKSAVLHRQIPGNGNSDGLFGWRDYYYLRNAMWFNKTHSTNALARFLRPLLLMVAVIVKAIKNRRWKNIAVVTAAYRDAMFGRLGKTVEPGQLPKSMWK